MVSSTPCVLREVNVQAFKHFRVVVIRGPEEPNGLGVVEEGVELWDVKVIAYPKFDEHLFVGMEGLQSLLQVAESLLVMSRVLSKIDEVEEGPECEHSLFGDLAHETSQEDAGHLFSLFP